MDAKLSVGALFGLLFYLVLVFFFNYCQQSEDHRYSVFLDDTYTITEVRTKRAATGYLDPGLTQYADFGAGGYLPKKEVIDRYTAVNPLALEIRVDGQTRYFRQKDFKVTKENAIPVVQRVFHTLLKPFKRGGLFFSDLRNGAVTLQAMGRSFMIFNTLGYWFFLIPFIIFLIVFRNTFVLYASDTLSDLFGVVDFTLPPRLLTQVAMTANSILVCVGLLVYSSTEQVGGMGISDFLSTTLSFEPPMDTTSYLVWVVWIVAKFIPAGLLYDLFITITKYNTQEVPGALLFSLFYIIYLAFYLLGMAMICIFPIPLIAFYVLWVVIKNFIAA